MIPTTQQLKSKPRLGYWLDESTQSGLDRIQKRSKRRQLGTSTQTKITATKTDVRNPDWLDGDSVITRCFVSIKTSTCRCINSAWLGESTRDRLSTLHSKTYRNTAALKKKNDSDKVKRRRKNKAYLRETEWWRRLRGQHKCGSKWRVPPIFKKSRTKSLWYSLSPFHFFTLSFLGVPSNSLHFKTYPK